MQNQKLEIKLPKPETKINGLNEAFIKFLASKKKVVVFSPHLDDAALSMGALISHLSENGIPVEVVTLFTQSSHAVSPSIQTMLGKAGFPNAQEYFQERRQEDAKALHVLGVDNLTHLGYIDAAWRITKKGDPVYPTYNFDIISEHDTQLLKDIKKNLKDYVKLQKNTVFFTAVGRGRHVDHLITRNVVTSTIPQVFYFEDFPYSVIYKNVDSFVQEKNLVPYEWKGSYEKKRDAIYSYKTQLPSFLPFSNNGVLTLSFEKFYIPSSFDIL